LKNAGIFFAAAIIVSFSLSFQQAYADTLSFDFTDPQGDVTNAPDILTVSVEFDNITGDYTVIVTADPANPFVGDFAFFLNLWNPDVDPVLIFVPPPEVSAILSKTLNNHPSNTILMFSGTNFDLIGWEAGDQVLSWHDQIDHPGTGNSLFESITVNLNSLSSRDIMRDGPTTISLVPSNGDSQVIGGEIIPIETTSLILAGAQSFSWMIPVVLSVLGIGLFVVTRKKEC